MLNELIDETIDGSGGMTAALSARIRRLQNANFIERVKGGNGMFYKDGNGMYHMLTPEANIEEENRRF